MKVSSSLNLRRSVQVCLGQAATLIGTLTYVRQGQREHSVMAYDEGWLLSSERFNVSADLSMVLGYQTHKARSKVDAVFHGAIADTAPDAWGRRVIAREHAKRRKKDSTLQALTEIDYLLAVDDFSRVGALRLRDPDGDWLRTTLKGASNIPPLVELGRVFQASQAVEKGEESVHDLRYLQGKATSLGGMRPKCSVIDEDGWLAIGKFPSVSDARSVTRGEVLALKLAKLAGIDVTPARLVQIDDVAIAVMRRFDRDQHGGRIPYQSVASILQASREEDRSYVEIADAIRRCSHAPIQDLQELWRRLVFNLLITNVDDHLQNHGFLHVEQDLWRLSPAFDINPFPDKDRESKTLLSEQDGPITDITMLLARAPYFALHDDQAMIIVAEVVKAVAAWRNVALSSDVGLTRQELDDFAPAFQHQQIDQAKAILGIPKSALIKISS